jgi:superfamily I DNA/RNA helicase
MDIDIKGKRSRILKRSYRNTFQILTAANELVSDSTVVDDLKGDDEELIPPDLNPLTMRPGPMPVIWQIHDPSTVAQHIAVEMGKLRAQFGFRWGDIAVFVKENVRDGDRLPEGLRSRNIPLQISKGQDIDIAADQVKLLTLHASKGLEFSAVFIVDVDRVGPRNGIGAEDYQRELAEQRRLLYVGMTRARDRLYLMHSLPLQDWLNGALKSVLRLNV